MSVKWKTVKNNIPIVESNIKGIKSKKVKIGAFKGDMFWLAGIHEYGADVKAKNVQYLTVPVCSEAAGRKASEFSNLFVYTSKKGNKMLARNEGGELKFYYWLTPSVKIPERSFLRKGHDENADRIIRQTERALGQVVAGHMSIDDVLDLYGQQMSRAISTYMRDLKSPPNSPITIENKGSSNPLADTGQLIESIDWRVE